MKAQDRKDFKVMQFERKGVDLWSVYVGPKSRPIRYTTCRSEEQAEEYARLLNLNPYLFDRQDWIDFNKNRTKST